MVDMNETISIITLSNNGLNIPIKRQGLPEQIKKQDPTRCCLQETNCKYTDIHRLTINGKKYTMLILFTRKWMSLLWSVCFVLTKNYVEI